MDPNENTRGRDLARLALAISLLALASTGAGCPGRVTDLMRDLDEARAVLAKVDLASATSRVAPPDDLKPVRDLEGDGAAEFLEALEDYRGLRRPEPSLDFTAIEPGPGLDPSPFLPFADSESARLILQGARRQSCRITGAAVPLGRILVDGEILSLDACVKMVYVLAARALALELSGKADEAREVLLGALSFGMHLEEDSALANCATGRAVQIQAAFQLEQFYRRAKDTDRERVARAFGSELMHRGRSWILLPFLNVLCSDGEAVLEAADIAVRAGQLALACDTAASVALGRFRNLDESAKGPSPNRFQALAKLKKAFPDAVMQEVVSRAEGMLVWSPQEIEEFAASNMQGVKRY